MRLLVLGLVACLGGIAAEAFSWGVSKQQVLDGSPKNSSREYNHDVSPIPPLYELALNELQELESEPLCHRNAARLLVNHCQLLQGKDEATVLTDSGRASRDFVDSYAASLAICDLERGSFRIPLACAQFQEEALLRLAVPKKPELHVTSSEINSCLKGLAESDSAWNTWVSYRHKALRFCDAARADNEKDEHIRLYQRITKIMSRLTTDVEDYMRTRLQDIDNTIQHTNSYLEILSQKLESTTTGLEDRLQSLGQMVSKKLYKSAEESHDVVTRVSNDANVLHDLVRLMMQDMMHRSEAIANAHDNALENFKGRANSELEAVMSNLAVVVSASTHLQNELASSHARVKELSDAQQRVQENMRNLELQANGISTQYDQHGEQLRQAQSSADQILSTLDTAATTATSFTASLSSAIGIQGWWPYIYCPAASLLMGSYGLPPSALRNIALVGLGEVAGFFISHAPALISSWDKTTEVPEETAAEAHVIVSEPWKTETDMVGHEMRRKRHVHVF